MTSVPGDLGTHGRQRRHVRIGPGGSRALRIPRKIGAAKPRGVLPSGCARLHPATGGSARLGTAVTPRPHAGAKCPPKPTRCRPCPRNEHRPAAGRPVLRFQEAILSNNNEMAISRGNGVKLLHCLVKS